MDSFKELNISAPLMQSIEALGFEKPSPIQAQALPILLGEPTDFIGLAATGTGKTAAFSIPLLERIDPKARHVQALILCPTRELAMQVCGQIELLGKHGRVRAQAIYGGSGYREQIDGLRSGVPVVVGTPGRLLDHIEKGTLKLDQLRTLVLDEADEMISMGFREDLEKILARAPRESSQIWLFSATMSREVRRVADTYLREPRQVQVNQTEMLSETVEQIYYFTKESNKPEILCKIIDVAENFFGIIFCQTKALVEDLTEYLNGRGYKVDCLHGDKDQRARERTMQAFREHRVNILVCTDVASRGLDVKDVTHVINYSLPRELDSYVHRIGRTARSGKQGYAMSLVTPSHKRILHQIEKLTRSRIHEGKIPTRRDVGLKKAGGVLEKFLAQSAHPRAAELFDEKWASALEGMTPAEVAARFLCLSLPEVFAEREEARPAPAEREERSRSRDERPARWARPERDERPPRFSRPEGGQKFRGGDRPPKRGPGKGPWSQKRKPHAPGHPRPKHH